MAGNYFHFNYEVDNINPIIQMNKLRVRQVQQHAEGSRVKYPKLEQIL